MDVYPGRVVYSKAGRDKNRFFVVLSVLDENYVLICDGDLRPVDKPKKKKLKHLQITTKEISLVKKMLENSRLPTDSEVRKSLEAILFFERKV